AGGFFGPSPGRSAMRLSPLLRTVARGLARFQPPSGRLLLALPIASDEDRLVLGNGRQLHPRQLGPAAGDAEEALPVTSGEAHDAFGPHDVTREACDQTLEPFLIEAAHRAIDEAREPVGVEMPRVT